MRSYGHCIDWAVANYLTYAAWDQKKPLTNTPNGLNILQERVEEVTSLWVQKGQLALSAIALDEFMLYRKLWGQARSTSLGPKSVDNAFRNLISYLIMQANDGNPHHLEEKLLRSIDILKSAADDLTNDVESANNLQTPYDQSVAHWDVWNMRQIITKTARQATTALYETVNPKQNRGENISRALDGIAPGNRFPVNKVPEDSVDPNQENEFSDTEEEIEPAVKSETDKCAELMLLTRDEFFKEWSARFYESDSDRAELRKCFVEYFKAQFVGTLNVGLGILSATVNQSSLQKLLLDLAEWPGIIRETELIKDTIREGRKALDEKLTPNNRIGENLHLYYPKSHRNLRFLDEAYYDSTSPPAFPEDPFSDAYEVNGAPDSDTESEPDSDTESEPELEPELEPKLEPKLEPELEPELEPKVEPKFEVNEGSPCAELKKLDRKVFLERWVSLFYQARNKEEIRECFIDYFKTQFTNTFNNGFTGEWVNKAEFKNIVRDLLDWPGFSRERDMCKSAFLAGLAALNEKLGDDHKIHSDDIESYLPSHSNLHSLIDGKSHTSCANLLKLDRKAFLKGWGSVFASAEDKEVPRKCFVDYFKGEFIKTLNEGIVLRSTVDQNKFKNVVKDLLDWPKASYERKMIRLAVKAGMDAVNEKLRDDDKISQNNIESYLPTHSSLHLLIDGTSLVACANLMKLDRKVFLQRWVSLLYQARNKEEIRECFIDYFKTQFTNTFNNGLLGEWVKRAEFKNIVRDLLNWPRFSLERDMCKSAFHAGLAALNEKLGDDHKIYNDDIESYLPSHGNLHLLIDGKSHTRCGNMLKLDRKDFLKGWGSVFASSEDKEVPRTCFIYYFKTQFTNTFNDGYFFGEWVKREEFKNIVRDLLDWPNAPNEREMCREAVKEGINALNKSLVKENQIVSQNLKSYMPPHHNSSILEGLLDTYYVPEPEPQTYEPEPEPQTYEPEPQPQTYEPEPQPQTYEPTVNVEAPFTCESLMQLNPENFFQKYSNDRRNVTQCVMEYVSTQLSSCLYASGLGLGALVGSYTLDEKKLTNLLKELKGTQFHQIAGLEDTLKDQQEKIYTTMGTVSPAIRDLFFDILERYELYYCTNFINADVIAKLQQEQAKISQYKNTQLREDRIDLLGPIFGCVSKKLLAKFDYAIEKVSRGVSVLESMKKDRESMQNTLLLATALFSEFSPEVLWRLTNKFKLRCAGLNTKVPELTAEILAVNHLNEISRWSENDIFSRIDKEALVSKSDERLHSLLRQALLDVKRFLEKKPKNADQMEVHQILIRALGRAIIEDRITCARVVQQISSEALEKLLSTNNEISENVRSLIPSIIDAPNIVSIVTRSSRPQVIETLQKLAFVSLGERYLDSDKDWDTLGKTVSRLDSNNLEIIVQSAPPATQDKLRNVLGDPVEIVKALTTEPTTATEQVIQDSIAKAGNQMVLYKKPDNLAAAVAATSLHDVSNALEPESPEVANEVIKLVTDPNPEQAIKTYLNTVDTGVNTASVNTGDTGVNTASVNTEVVAVLKRVAFESFTSDVQSESVQEEKKKRIAAKISTEGKPGALEETLDEVPPKMRPEVNPASFTPENIHTFLKAEHVSQNEQVMREIILRVASKNVILDPKLTAIVVSLAPPKTIKTNLANCNSRVANTVRSILNSRDPRKLTYMFLTHPKVEGEVKYVLHKIAVDMVTPIFYDKFTKPTEDYETRSTKNRRKYYTNHKSIPKKKSRR